MKGFTFKDPYFNTKFFVSVDSLKEKEYQRKKDNGQSRTRFWSLGGHWSFSDYYLNILAGANRIKMTFQV